MNYKDIIKSRSVRIKILRLLLFIPDKQMIQLQYRIKTGRRLNLKNPQRFTEKMQWYKLYYRDPKMIQCVDKYDVREYVESKGLDQYLNKCYGVYEDVKDVDWQSLPDQFVMKDTLGGGGISVIIIRNKEKEDPQKQAVKLIGPKVKGSGREWPYYSGKNHRLIIEEMIESNPSEGGLIDYKFFCFNGKVEFLYVMGDREIGKSVKVSLFDRNFVKLPVSRVGDEEFLKARKPENFDEMISVAEKLSEEFPHVRVDLYNVNGKILFGELTFYNASGYMLFEPDSFDVEIGKRWDIKDYNNYNTKH